MPVPCLWVYTVTATVEGGKPRKWLLLLLRRGTKGIISLRAAHQRRGDVEVWRPNAAVTRLRLRKQLQQLIRTYPAGCFTCARP